jgi:GT2 family glycosyltransferase/glycosyltransferase involved in cell wall biosynthesis
VRLPDLLILGQEQWDHVERRNQLLIRALAARNPSTRFLFAEHALRLRNVSAWRWPQVVPVATNIWKTQLLRPVPDRLATGLSDVVEARQAAWAARRAGLDRPYLWSQDPHAARLLELLPVQGLIYDLTDDWAAFEPTAERRHDVQGQVAKLARSASLVVACSRALCELAERSGARPLYLPNAVDASSEPGAIPPDLARLPHPRIGYVGTLHSARLDVALLVRTAALRPEWSFVFIGPDLLRAPDRERLFAPANVYYLGTVPHSDVRHYIGGFDVALVPNLVTEFTASLDPLKTYEYLAVGVPVLATPAGVAPELAEHVHLASTAEELVTRAEQLIEEESNELAAARRLLVKEETWDARAAAVEEAMGLGGPPARRTGVSVVVVSYNTRELLKRCLASVAEQELDVQTIVVDNCSTDGSPAMVQEQFPGVELVRLTENVGFGAANNVAFARCQGEHILLLNSDAFLHRGALRALLDASRRHLTAAVVGPRLLNPDGTLQRSAWPCPDPVRLLIEATGLHRILRRTPFYEDLGIWDHRSERAVDFLSGACLLLRQGPLEEAGGFDERFYVYGEETDLQRRLHTRGWSVFLAPTASVTHIGGASATTPKNRLSQFYGAQLSFLRKHRGVGAVAAARFALLVGSLLRGRWQVARLALTPSLGRPR